MHTDINFNYYEIKIGISINNEAFFYWYMALLLACLHPKLPVDVLCFYLPQAFFLSHFDCIPILYYSFWIFHWHQDLGPFLVIFFCSFIVIFTDLLEKLHTFNGIFCLLNHFLEFEHSKLDAVILIIYFFLY